jgi:hypothetical protein
MRESRVSKPSAFNAPRRVASNCSKRAGDAVPHRAGLAVGPPPVTLMRTSNFSAVPVTVSGCVAVDALRFQREIIFKLASVDGDFAGAGREPDARDGGLAPSRAEIFGILVSAICQLRLRVGRIKPRL